jgi:hypothetical protein
LGLVSHYGTDQQGSTTLLSVLGKERSKKREQSNKRSKVGDGEVEKEIANIEKE